jgi:CheY-like chemotaxis protein
VTVTLHQTGNSVTATVSDTGVGIRRDVLPFVFDRFRQADASSTRLHGGLGLGLAIVRHIVELHGGTVTVQSDEGRGASFTVELPAAAPAHAERDRTRHTATARNTERGPDTALLQGVRVLVVDDDPDARDLVAEIVRAAGGTVTTAASAREALERMGAFRPDALIADIGLPREDGYALIRQVRQRVSTARQPVAIALTGYARAEDRARALAAGYQEHVAKPVEPSTLVRIVRAILDAR